MWQHDTTMKAPRLAFLLALAALVPCALHAERINPADDLLAGDVPDTRLSIGGGGTSGQWSGENIWSFLNASDASFGMFNMSSIDDPGCYVDLTVNLSKNFTPSECFNTYAIRVAKSGQYQSVDRAPKKWQVFGKTDEEGADWVLLDTEKEQTGWQFADNGGDTSVWGVTDSPGETRYYHFENGGIRYKYLRFRFLENNGNGSYLLVTQIILYSAATPASGATEETFANCVDLVPPSTSATQSRYTTTTHTASGSFSAGNVSEPFSDHDPARVLMELSVSDTADIIYEFGTDDKKIVNGYMVRFTDHQYTTLGRAPYSWTFYGSDDYEHWTAVDSRTDQVSWGKGEKRYYLFENHTAYAYYKILFTQNNGATDRYEFGNLDYYYLPQAGVFFTGLDTAFSDGTLTVSGAVAMDSLAADVSVSIATNGVRFTQNCGTIQPGGTFSVSFPVSQGTLNGTLTGVSTDGAYTNSIVQGPVYIPGSSAARFVSPDGYDLNAGTSLEAPMRRIATAVASLGAEGGTVYVLPGSYTETNDLSAVELVAPVSVIGVTGEPEDVTVTQNAPCGWSRIFKLANASALVRSITMENGKVQNEPKDGYTASDAQSYIDKTYPYGVGVNGGNLWITAGTVENCIVKNGKVQRYAQAGGNVYMQGGRLSRCVVTGGDLVGSHGISTECGTSLLADGGIVESCLFTGTDDHVAPVCVGGTATMINCVVAGNAGTDCGGVLIKGINSRVLNTVIYGNIATAEGGNAVYLASKKTKPSDGYESSTFVNCASDGGTAINGSCVLVGASAFADAANGDYAPASRESPLVNTGANYAEAGGVSNLDLAGNPRVWTNKPDIGAFEFQYEVEPSTLILFR